MRPADQSTLDPGQLSAVRRAGGHPTGSSNARSYTASEDEAPLENVVSLGRGSSDPQRALGASMKGELAAGGVALEVCSADGLQSLEQKLRFLELQRALSQEKCASFIRDMEAAMDAEQSLPLPSEPASPIVAASPTPALPSPPGYHRDGSSSNWSRSTGPEVSGTGPGGYLDDVQWAPGAANTSPEIVNGSGLWPVLSPSRSPSREPVRELGPTRSPSLSRFKHCGGAPGCPSPEAGEDWLAAVPPVAPRGRRRRSRSFGSVTRSSAAADAATRATSPLSVTGVFASAAYGSSPGSGSGSLPLPATEANWGLSTRSLPMARSTTDGISSSWGAQLQWGSPSHLLRSRQRERCLVSEGRTILSEQPSPPNSHIGSSSNSHVLLMALSSPIAHGTSGDCSALHASSGNLRGGCSNSRSQVEGGRGVAIPSRSQSAAVSWSGHMPLSPDQQLIRSGSMAPSLSNSTWAADLMYYEPRHGSSANSLIRLTSHSPARAKALRKAGRSSSLRPLSFAASNRNASVPNFLLMEG